MKKRAYRAVELRNLDQASLCEAVDGCQVVVGVDVAKEVQFATVAVGGHGVVRTIRWSHPEQTPAFIGLLGALPAASVEIAMEPTGTYGDAIRYRLQQADLPVFRVSAKRVHDAAEVYDGVPSSHDAKAAAIIAKLHLDEASEPWPPADDAQRSLSSAISLMSHYNRQHQQDINALEALLARHWPEATRVMELGSVTLLTVLSVYGDPAEVASQPKEAQELMRRASRNAMAEQKRSELLRSAKDTIGVPLLSEERSLVRELAGDALRSYRAKEQARARIRELSRDIPEVTAMGSVVGMVTAAVLATKVGNPSDFDSARAFEKSIGLNLRERSSGQHKGGLKITKRGSGLARKYLYLAVLRLLNTDRIVWFWYRKKVARDGGTKMKAVVAVMRKLIRALWHVGRGDRFDSTKLFDVSRLGTLAVAS